VKRHFQNSAIGTIEDWDPKSNFVSQSVSKDNFKVGEIDYRDLHQKLKVLHSSVSTI
jgi:hypothetical protein